MRVVYFLWHYLLAPERHLPVRKYAAHVLPGLSSPTNRGDKTACIKAKVMLLIQIVKMPDGRLKLIAEFDFVPILHRRDGSLL